MYVICWHDIQGAYEAVGDGKAVLAIYDMLIQRLYNKFITIRHCATGCEVDPDKGLSLKINKGVKTNE